MMATFKTTEKQRQKAKAYYYANRDAIAERYRSLAEHIRQRRLESARRWRAANKEAKALYDKQWREANPHQWRELQRKQRHTPGAKLVSNLRRRLRDFVRTSSSRISLDFGCTPRQLRTHIEQQFDRRMSWANYGQWHIDHIVPCSAFDLSRLDHVRVCFNWQNLRPVWAVINIAKGDKLIYPQLKLPLSVLPTTSKKRNANYS